jgi:phosphopantothenoylcysteine synthetase/decarboxylase
MTDLPEHRILVLVVCAAPPAGEVHELIRLLRADSWDVHVVSTPAALSWIDVELLADRTGHPVKSEMSRPGMPRTFPEVNAIVVAPATFNTINRWAAGINDTLALGLLNEFLGSGIPMVAAPYAKAPLANHPTFQRNLKLLRDAGVSLAAPEELRSPSDGQPLRWEILTRELSRLAVQKPSRGS